MSTATPVLELIDVGMTYPGERPVHALRNVNLRIDAGDFVAVVGPSGSGKSTLLNVMGSLDRATAGTVRLGGLDLTRMSDAEIAAVRASHIGFVFQSFFLDNHFSALDNVADGLLYAGIRVAERRRRAAEALAWVGLADRATFLPNHLSGGQQQRVAIARAVVGRPALVLADEPTGNLDTASGWAILDLLRELHRQGATIVVITHDRDLAARLPRKVEVLDGQIVSDTRSEAAVPAESGAAAPRPAPTRLGVRDLIRLAATGLRARWQRAAMSALGIAIGVAATVAVLGLSASSQAGLLAEIDRLGTNLLTVTNGTSFLGQPVRLPAAAPSMVARLPNVLSVADTATTQFSGLSAPNVYRNALIPSGETGGITVRAASLDLPAVVGASVAQGSYLNAATAAEPVVVLGSQAAIQLGVDQVVPGERVWLGGMWFYVAGILNPAILAPEVDTSALIGIPAAGRYLGFDGHPSTLYVRAATDAVATVDNLLGPQADPEDPSGLSVSQPSKALVARAEAKNAFTGLFVGLAAVALFVGAIGVANIMVLSVLERRREIGLRRALGATRNHVRIQFLSEAILLGGLGGAVGSRLRRGRDGGVCADQGLGHRGAAAGLGRRAGRGGRHRRPLWPGPSAARRVSGPDGGPAHGLSDQPTLSSRSRRSHRHRPNWHRAETA